MQRRRRRRRRWAHTPVIHATNRFYHEKKVASVSISMHACDPVPIVMGLRLPALRDVGTPLQNTTKQLDIKLMPSSEENVYLNLAVYLHRKFLL